MQDEDFGTSVFLLTKEDEKLSIFAEDENFLRSWTTRLVETPKVTGQ